MMIFHCYVSSPEGNSQVVVLKILGDLSKPLLNIRMTERNAAEMQSG